jgi:hypothetical protein
MDQSRASAIASDDTALLQHISGQFKSHDTITNSDHIIESTADLHGVFKNHGHQPRDTVNTKANLGKGYDWYNLDRQELSSSTATLRHNGQTDSSGIGSQIGTPPAQRWQFEAAKAQPWNGLAKVSISRNSKATAKVSEAARKSKSWSMEIRKDSSSQRSFGDQVHCDRNL